jgi:hypothetical protein
MISIRRLMEGPDQAPDEAEISKLCGQLQHLLQEGIATRREWGRAAGLAAVDSTARDLLRRLDEHSPPAGPLNVFSEALEVFENHNRWATGYFREQHGQMQSMVGMLTSTIADISGHTDASVGRLQALERKIEGASNLGDIRELRAGLAACLSEVKESAIHQRNTTLAIIEQLREQIRRAARPASEPTAPLEGGALAPRVSEYLVAFKLQRAEHILARFGEQTLEQMLSLVAAGLKPVQGPQDRLVRRKGFAYIWFVKSMDNLPAVRRRVSAVVTRIGQRYVEAGENSALLAIGVDWLVFPQAHYGSLDDAFVEVDSFLAGKAEDGVHEGEGKTAAAAAGRRFDEPHKKTAK